MRKRSLRVLAVGAMGAVGGALVYFLDPRAGAERRRAAREWVTTRVRHVLGVSPEAVSPSEMFLGEPETEAVWSPPREAAPEPAAPRAPPEPVSELVTVPEGQETPEPEEIPEPKETPESELESVRSLRVATPIPSPPTVLEAASFSAPRRLGDEPSVIFLQPETSPPSQIISFDADGEKADSPSPPGPWPPAPEPEPRRGSRSPVWLLPSLAAAAATAAVAVGVWAVVLANSDGDGDRQAVEMRTQQAQVDEQSRAIALLSEPGAQRIPVAGTSGTVTLVVGGRGEAVLIISSLRRAPAGKAYQAWIIRNSKPFSAALFLAGTGQRIVPLTGQVPRGATVAVTLERARGVKAPTSTPLFAATRS